MGCVGGGANGAVCEGCGGEGGEKRRGGVCVGVPGCSGANGYCRVRREGGDGEDGREAVARKRLKLTEDI